MVETKKNPSAGGEVSIKFKGRFIETVGKRKSASAIVRLYKTGVGNIVVNGKKLNEYFTLEQAALATSALRITGLGKDIDVSVVASGGGKSGQADAVKLGISKALIEMNKELKSALKAKDLTTRDSRIKERKKPGLKRARRAPQWSKR